MDADIFGLVGIWMLDVYQERDKGIEAIRDRLQSGRHVYSQTKKNIYKENFIAFNLVLTSNESQTRLRYAMQPCS